MTHLPRSIEAILYENPPSKQAQFQAFLDRGGVFVHLDPRRSGVVAPASVCARSRVVLQVRHALTLPLPDIEVDDEAVRATLKFGGVPFRCTLPWSSVFSLVAEDGEVTVWPLELPPELAPPRGPVAVTEPGARRTEHPGRPVSLPPPSMGRGARSKHPSGSPARTTQSPRSAPSVAPGSLSDALRIPRAPALPRSLRPPDAEGNGSTPSASRELRANDGFSVPPGNDDGEG